MFTIRIQRDIHGLVCDHIDFVFSKSKMLIDASAIIESLKEIKLGKSAGIDGLAAEHFVYSHSRVSVHYNTIIYMYVESWASTDSIYENFNYSYLKKTETVTPVTKIIIDQLQLSQRCPNCLNCFYQNFWILSNM